MAVEDYTTYTEVDVPADHIQLVGTDHIDHYTVGDEDTYLYKDKTLGHFGDFEHFVNARSDFEAVSMRGVLWMVANALDDERGLYDADEPYLEVFLLNSSGTPVVYLRSFDGTTLLSDISEISANTWYYFRIKRATTTLTCKIYSTAELRDAGGDPDVGSLSVACPETTFQYIYACNSYNGGVPERKGDLDIENLDLQEEEGVTVTPSPASAIAQVVAPAVISVETLRPNVAGDETNIEYQIPDSGAHWEKVDEVVADTSTYVRQVTGWARDLYNLPASSGSGTINKVTLYFRVKAYSNVGQVKGAIKSDSTVTETAAKTPYYDFGNDTWGTYSQEWATNPADSQPWEWADIDALQIGIALKGETGIATAYCTQVYVEVDYIPSLVVTPSPIQAIGKVTAPIVLLGSTTATPEYIKAIAQVIQPTVKLGNIIFSPEYVKAIAKGVNPTVVKGSLTLSPSFIVAIAKGIDPAVILGSTTATPEYVKAVAGVIQPYVSGGVVYVTPDPASTIAGIVAPTVVLGSIVITPDEAYAIGQVIPPNVILGSIIISNGIAESIVTVVAPTVIGGDITLTPESIEAIARGENPEVILASMTVTPEFVKALAGVIAPTVLETWIGRKLRIKIVTSQYRSLDIVTSQHRNIDVVTTQKRKIRILTTGG